MVAPSPLSTSPTRSPSTAWSPPLQAAVTSLTPLPSAPTFHVIPCHLVFGNDHSPRVLSKPQQPLLPPAALGLPVREPIAHCTRSHATAPLALFASGRLYHECVQYRIPTAKFSRSPPVVMGFAGLCTMHHMMTAKTTTNFAILYSALLHNDNPLALTVLDPTTGNMLEHCQLQFNPWYKTTWDTLYTNELCRLYQGIGSGEAPSSKHVAGTNTFFCIDYHDIPLHKRKEICHTMVVYEVRLDKENPNCTQITPLVATASATLAMWVLTQCCWSCSSSSSTVASLGKVPALAPLIVKTSILILPCPSPNMFASKSWTSPTNSLMNTSLQVWTVTDGFTLKSARVATACPEQAS